MLKEQQRRKTRILVY